MLVGHFEVRFSLGHGGAAVLAGRGLELSRGHEVADVGEVERQERDEDEHAAEQGVEEELDGRVLAARPAPDADEEVHRQEHHLPEDVEEEEVEREERAEHARFQHQKQDAISANELVDLPAGDHGQEAERGGQQDEGHTDAVGAEEVVDVEVLDPRVAGDPVAAVGGAGPGEFVGRGGAAGQRLLGARLRGVEDAVDFHRVLVEIPEHADAEAERQGRPDQGPPAHGLFLAAREEQEAEREHAGHEHHQRHPDAIPFPRFREHIVAPHTSPKRQRGVLSKPSLALRAGFFTPPAPSSPTTSAPKTRRRPPAPETARSCADSPSAPSATRSRRRKSSARSRSPTRR